LNRCDYIVNKGRIGNENDRTEAYKFKWDDEFICQRRMKGDHPRGYNVTTDEDDYDPDDEEEEEQDEDLDIDYNEMKWEDEYN
jgi:hypothetical protein